MTRLLIRSYRRRHPPAVDALVAAALPRDGAYGPGDLRRLVDEVEWRFINQDLQVLFRHGFRFSALSAGDGANPQVRVDLRRSVRGWVLDKAETAIAILTQPEQIQIVAAEKFVHGGILSYSMRRCGWLAPGEEIDLVAPVPKCKVKENHAEVEDESYLDDLVL